MRHQALVAALMCGDSGWTARFIIHGLTFHLITFYYEAVQDSVNQPVLGAPEAWRRACGVFTDGFNQENFYSDTLFITHTHTHSHTLSVFAPDSVSGDFSVTLSASTCDSLNHSFNRFSQKHFHSGRILFFSYL